MADPQEHPILRCGLRPLPSPARRGFSSPCALLIVQGILGGHPTPRRCTDGSFGRLDPHLGHRTSSANHSSDGGLPKAFPRASVGGSGTPTHPRTFQRLSERTWAFGLIRQASTPRHRCFHSVWHVRRVRLSASYLCILPWPTRTPGPCARRTVSCHGENRTRQRCPLISPTPREVSGRRAREHPSQSVGYSPR